MNGATEPDLPPQSTVDELIDKLVGRLRAVPGAPPERIATEFEEETAATLEELETEADFPTRAVRWLRENGGEVSRLANCTKLEVMERLMLKPTGATVALIGPQGAGKTVLAVALGLAAIREHRKTVRYTRLLRLLLRFEHARRDHSTESRLEVMEEACRPRLLIIDECGKGFGTEAELRLVFELLDERHNLQLDTLLISNQPDYEFESWAGDSIIRRINEGGGLVLCDRELLNQT